MGSSLGNFESFNRPQSSKIVSSEIVPKYWWGNSFLVLATLPSSHNLPIAYVFNPYIFLMNPLSDTYFVSISQCVAYLVILTGSFTEQKFLILMTLNLPFFNPFMDYSFDVVYGFLSNPTSQSYFSYVIFQSSTGLHFILNL